MELLFAPESLPFTGAIIFVLLLGALETISLLLGASLFGLFGHIDIDVPHIDHIDIPHVEHIDIAHIDTPHLDADSGLGWLHVGKVPMLVLLVLFLSSFATVGLSCNALSHYYLGSYPNVYLSSGVAFLSAILAVRVLGNVIAKLIPKDETSAVSLDTLVGHIAIIINGTARKNNPAQARVTTEKGQTFYIRVEPEHDYEQFNTHDSVLLIKQLSGSHFLACANPHPDLL